MSIFSLIFCDDNYNCGCGSSSGVDGDDEDGNSHRDQLFSVRSNPGKAFAQTQSYRDTRALESGAYDKS